MKFFYMLLFGASVLTHPQCLDYFPPFTSKSRLSFCGEFSAYGCCTTSDDDNLARVYDLAIRDNTTCSTFVRDLLCLRCHPYAAHIFDAEKTNQSLVFKKKHVLFPGLCADFCELNYEPCKQALLATMTDSEFLSFVFNSTRRGFCDWAQLEEVKYCYPDLKNASRDIPANDDFESDITLCVEPMDNFFSNPLVGVHANDGSHRLFVGEQLGYVHIMTSENVKLSPPFLNITGKVLNSGNAWDERGFLSLVFHPNYQSNGRFYVSYSALVPNRSEILRVSEFVVDENNPNIANHSSELVLLEISQPEPNHNGGMLFFGSDGYFYVSVGDGGGAGDEHGEIGNGLNMSTLLGKILRIDVDTEERLYAIPPGNPFIGKLGVREEIYASGMRNAWKCSVDKGDVRTFKGRGRIFCGDVGQNRIEEINLIVKGGNYGWRAYEGDSCYDEKLCGGIYKHLKFPLISYNHTYGQSIVGGYVYRGCSNPDLYGKYLFADTMNGRLFLAEEVSPNNWIQRNVLIGNKSICNNALRNSFFENILSFAESEFGEVYILSTFYPRPTITNGRLYRIVDPFKRGDPNTCNFKATIPTSHGTITRRKVYETVQQELERRSSCKDLTKNICESHFQRVNGKDPIIKCSSASSYARKYCRRTCKYCDM